jgi:nucleoside-diphosphate-sugar epimerase
MKILVAGGSGAIGKFLVPMLAERGHEVYALGRSLERLRAIQQPGVHVFACDVFDRDRLEQVAAEAQPEVVVDQLTQIPRQINPRRAAQELAPTNRLRTEGTRNLMQAAVQNDAKRFVSASVAFAYAPQGGDPAIETDPLYLDAPGGFLPAVEAVAEHERIVLGSAGVQGVVLRYGYFYGPGTVYALDGSFTQDVLKRRLPIIGDGQGQFSFIHLADAAEASVHAIEGEMSGVYNIVDDEPVMMNQFLPWFAKLLDAAPPLRLPRLIGQLAGGPYGVYLMTRQRGASNEKAKEVLGWQPKFPTWREGFAAGFKVI